MMARDYVLPASIANAIQWFEGDAHPVGVLAPNPASKDQRPRVMMPGGVIRVLENGDWLMTATLPGCPTPVRWACSDINFSLILAG